MLEAVKTTMATGRIESNEAQDTVDGFVLVKSADIPDEDATKSSLQAPPNLNHIRAWLQPTEYEDDDSELKKHLASHFEGTGQWLLDSSVYRQWHESRGDGILWIRGIPGSGKSVFAANLVDRLRLEGCPVLYFFFRHTIDSNHSPEAAFRDFLAQIIGLSPPLQLECARLSGSQNSSTNAVCIDNVKLEDLFRLLRLALATISKAYCIVDALDEMDQSRLEPFLHCLDSLGQWRPATIKAIMTSRPLATVENIVRNLKVLDIRLDKGLVEPDIASFVKHRLKVLDLPHDTISPITERILRKAGGLFLHAKLAIDTLVHMPANVDIEESLAVIPSDLSRMYTNLLREHSKRTGIPKDLQMLVLECVTHSIRPLRLLELSDLILVTQCQYARTRGEMKNLIRTVCGPLIEILPDETVRVVHHSLTEYLLGSNDPADGSQEISLKSGRSHNHMGLLCINYLGSGCLKEIEHSSGVNNKSVLLPSVHHPFSRYALNYWHVHIRRAMALDEDQEEINLALKKLLFDLEVFPKLIMLDRFKPPPLFLEDQKLPDINFQTQMHLPAFILRLAMQLGLWKFVELMLQDETLDVKEYNENILFSPLVTAVVEDCQSIVHLLAQQGVSLNSHDGNGITALHAAVGFRGYTQPNPSMAHLLIEKGADVWKSHTMDAQFMNTPEEPAIKYAFEHGNEDMISAFLPCIKSTKSASQALEWAIRSLDQTPRVIQFILRHSFFDVNAKGLWGTPLFLASSMREPGRIETLLAAGADPNILHGNASSIQKGEGHNVLHELAFHQPYFCREGRVSGEILSRCFQLVLAAGANGMFHIQLQCNALASLSSLKCINQAVVNQRGPFGIPLHLADDVVAVEHLLDAGADVQALTSSGETVLHKCSDEKILRLVAERADINVRAASGHTALTKLLATGEFSNSVFERALLLVSAGIDVTLKDNEGNTALHYAVRISNTRPHTHCLTPLIATMIAKGADVNLVNNAGEAPIHWFRWQGCCSIDILTTLVKAGANLEAKDMGGRTPMMVWAGRHHSSQFPDIARVFDKMAEYGASFTTTDGLGRTLLHAAVPQGEDISEFVQYLYNHGVDPKQTDNAGNTLWHAAIPRFCAMFHCQGRYAQITQLGVDPCAPNAVGHTPLHSVCMHRQDFMDDDDWKHNYDLLNTYPAVLDYMMNVYKDVNCGDNRGITPLHYTSTFSEMLTFRLLQNGADLFQATLEGLTALHLAARSRQANIVGLVLETLRSAGSSKDCVAFINAKDNLGRTALYYACRSGRVESVRLLLDSGATVRVGPFEGSAWQGCADFETELDDQLWSRRVTEKASCYPRYWLVSSTGADKVHSWGYFGAFAGSCQIATRDRPVHIIHCDTEFQSSCLFPMERLQDIVSLLTAHDSIATCNSIDEAIKSAVNRSFNYTAEVLSRVRQNLAPRQSIECERDLATCIKKRRAFVNTSLQEPCSFQHRMALRDFDAAVNDIGTLESLLLHDSQSAGHIMSHLIEGGYAWLIDKLTTQEIVSNLETNIYNSTNNDTEDSRDSHSISKPLIVAACQRKDPNIEVLCVLIQRGADVNAQMQSTYATVSGRSALHFLATSNNWWQSRLAIPLLVKHGADLELKDSHGQTPLRLALNDAGAPWFNHEAVKILLELGADPNSVDMDEVSCLQKACRCEKTFKLLLQHGAVFSYEDVIYPIYQKDLHTLELMLRNGADPNICYTEEEVLTSEPIRAENDDDHLYDRVEVECYYPLNWVIYSSVQYKQDLEKSVRICKLLLKFGADPAADYTHTTAMHRVLQAKTRVYADEYKKPVPLLPFFKLFVDHPGFDIEARDTKGYTMLHYACQNRHELVQLLIDHGADVRARDPDGQLPIHIYLQSPSRRIDGVNVLASLLLKHKTPELLNEVDSHGMSLLHLALQDGAGLKKVEILLNAGIEVCLAPTSTGDTLLHFLLKSTWLVDEYGVIGGRLRKQFEQFLASGASINTRNNHGETPIFNFFRTGRVISEEQIKLQQEHPRYSEIQALSGKPKRIALRGIAAVEAEPLIWAFLDEAHVDWTIKNNKGQSLLHIVASDQTQEQRKENNCRGRRVARFRFLLSKGLDAMAEDDEHRTALDTAAALDNQDILGLFASSSA